MDQPLIIKVASVPQARMQVYFIDNEEYFRRKSTFYDEDHELYDDNDERSLFFGKGVIETVKKLGWQPDIIHIHGWMTSTLPLYLRQIESDDPLFADAKIVFSTYDNAFEGELGPNIYEGMDFDGIEEECIKNFKKPTFVNLNKGAIQYSDALIKGSAEIDEKIVEYAKELGKPVHEGATLGENPEDAVAIYSGLVEEATVA
jgi:starch synthase